MIVKMAQKVYQLTERIVCSHRSHFSSNQKWSLWTHAQLDPHSTVLCPAYQSNQFALDSYCSYWWVLAYKLAKMLSQYSQFMLQDSSDETIWNRMSIDWKLPQIVTASFYETLLRNFTPFRRFYDKTVFIVNTFITKWSQCSFRLSKGLYYYSKKTDRISYECIFLNKSG